MAVQMHVIYSDMFSGAGIIAGGPFYCAQDNVMIAQTSCMKDPGTINLLKLETITESTFLTTHTIANPSNLKNQKVWIFSGSKDTEVVPGVVGKLDTYYKHYKTSNTFVNNVPAQHSFPTDLP
jgi:predicted peptidase